MGRLAQRDLHAAVIRVLPPEDPQLLAQICWCSVAFAVKSPQVVVSLATAMAAMAVNSTRKIILRSGGGTCVQQLDFRHRCFLCKAGVLVFFFALHVPGGLEARANPLTFQTFPQTHMLPLSFYKPDPSANTAQ